MRTALPSVCLLGLAALASPCQATANEPVALTDAPDTVFLTDGGFYRGQIVEFDPDSHLVLRTVTGELKRFPVEALARALRSEQDLLAAKGPRDEASAPLLPAKDCVAADSLSGELQELLSQIPGPRVRLHVTAEPEGVLQRRIGRETSNSVAYHLVCNTPCNVALPAADRAAYRIGGNRRAPTDWFEMPTEDASIRAELVAPTWEMWPTALFGAAVLSTLTGGASLGIGHAINNDYVRVSGWSGLGLAAALLVSSASVWLFSPESTLAFEPLPSAETNGH